ncbi:MAG: hypothetical protein JST21_14510, partial [Bacteroidetes bacterium]|nr:hypothetical protein [Bacteroidota bacterium]
VSLNPDVLKSHHKTVNIPVNGYLYVYCSNESNIDLFFDNLQACPPKEDDTNAWAAGGGNALLSVRVNNGGD